MDFEYDTEISNGCCSKLARGLICIRDGLFGVLYLLAKDNKPTSSNMLFFHRMVNTFQLLHFAFTIEGQFAWHWWITKYMSPFFSVFSFGIVTQFSDTFIAILFGLGFVILFVTFLLMSVVWFEFATTGGVKNLWILPILRFMLNGLTTVLYLPLLALMVLAFGCSTEAINQYIPCGSTLQTCLTVTIVFLLGSFVLFVGCVQLVFGQRDPTSLDPLGSAHKRIGCISTLTRALVKFCFTFLGDRDPDVPLPHKNKVALIFIVLGTGISLTASNLYYMPFYSTKTNKLTIASFAIYLWAGICLVLSEFVVKDSQDYSSMVLVIIGCPFFVYCSVVAVDKRVAWFQNLPAHVQLSPYIDEVRLRISYSFDKLDNTDSEYSQEAKKAYLDAAKRHRQSGFFCLHAATLLDKIWNNQIMASQLTSLADSVSIAFDQRFVLYAQGLQSREKRTGAKGAISYLAFDHHAKQAEGAMLESVELIVDFWGLLERGNYTVSDLHRLSVLTHRSSNRCLFHVKRLLGLSQGSKEALMRYALYYEYVLNDQYMSKKISYGIRQKSLDTKRIVDRLNSANKNTGSAVLSIRGTSTGSWHRTGDILYASRSITEFIGLDSKDILNRNLVEYLGPRITQVFPQYLSHLVETVTTFDSIDKLLWLNHKDGYCVLADCSITPVVNEDAEIELSLNLTAASCADKFLLLSKEGYILTGSEPMLTHINAQQFVEGVVHVQDVLNSDYIDDILGKPNVKRSREFSVSENGYAITVQDIAVKQVWSCEEAEKDGEENEKSDENEMEIVILFSLRPDKMAMLVPELTSDIKFENSTTLRKTQQNENDLGAIKEEDTPAQQGKSFFSDGKMLHVFRDRLEAKIKTPNPRVKEFNWFSLRFTCGGIFLSLIWAVAAFILYQNYLEGWTCTANSHERAVSLLSIVDYTHALELDETKTDPSYEDKLKTFLNISIGELQGKHELLSKVLHTSPPEAASKFKVGYGDAFLVINELGENVVTNLWVSVFQFISHARVFLKTEYPKCEDSCHWILENGENGILQSAKNDSHSFFESQGKALELIFEYHVIFAILAASGSLYALWALYLPMVFYTNHRRRITVAAFASIPSTVVKEMIVLYRTRLKELSQSAEGSDEKEDTTLNMSKLLSGAGDDDANQGVNSTSSFFRSFRLSSRMSHISSVNSMSMFSEALRNRIAKDSRFRRLVRVVFLSLRLSFPSLLLVVYFLPWSTMLYTPRIERAQNSAYYSGERWVETIELLGYLRNININDSETVSSLRMSILDIHDSLLLGSSEYGTSPIESETDLYWLTFKDGCTNLNYPTGVDCIDSTAGLTLDTSMNLGLHLSLTRLLEFALQVERNTTKYMETKSESLLQDIHLNLNHVSQGTELVQRYSFALKQARDLAAVELDTVVFDTIGGNNYFTMGFVLLFLFSHIVVTSSVRNIDSENKKNLILVMMLPSKVFVQTPNILRIIESDWGKKAKKKRRNKEQTSMNGLYNMNKGVRTSSTLSSKDGSLSSFSSVTQRRGSLVMPFVPQSRESQGHTAVRKRKPIARSRSSVTAAARSAKANFESKL